MTNLFFILMIHLIFLFKRGGYDMTPTPPRPPKPTKPAKKEMEVLYTNYIDKNDSLLENESCSELDNDNLKPKELQETVEYEIYTDFEQSNNSPLDQFIIRNLLGIDAPILADTSIYLTNIGLYLTTASLIILMIFFLGNNYNKIISNNWSASQEAVYATVHSIVINQINQEKGQIYFPFIFVLFVFILSNNLIGMVPYSFASTSHFILTFSISFTIVLGATLLGLRNYNLKFFSLFVPNGCPLPLLPLLVLIEFISYLARNISLGLRLAANVLSGHLLLNILSGFTYNIMNSGYIYFFLGLIPLIFIIAFSGLEIGIAFIQAQVFVVLSCSYIKDGLVLH